MSAVPCKPAEKKLGKEGKKTTETQKYKIKGCISSNQSWAFLSDRHTLPIRRRGGEETKEAKKELGSERWRKGSLKGV